MLNDQANSTGGLLLPYDKRLIADMSDYTIKELYNKVDQLIRHCEQLSVDRDELKLREQQWLQERERLVEKNKLARTRVEGMISHLKKLQQGTG